MSRSLSILIVDDSLVVRRMLSEMLSGNPAFGPVSTASNGKIALARVPQIKPDAVILDVEMPEMDGLQTVAAIRRFDKKLPIIMFSTLTARGASATLEALSLGANDYVTKPSSRSGTVGQLGLVYQDLVDKIKLHCRHDSDSAPGGLVSKAAASLGNAPVLPRRSGISPGLHVPPAESIPPGPVDVIAIGVSTGGPNALAALLPAFPADLSVPILIVQHMPRLFTKMLAERLATKASIPVEEAGEGSLVVPGKAWIAPGDYHMVIRRVGVNTVIRINQDSHENSCRPSVDPLFRSVAEIYGPRALGVVLTGMGQDGFRGCEAIRAQGGQVLVQDEASSVVWGMPGFVAKAGLAHRILPLSDLGAEIVRRTRRSEALTRLPTQTIIGAAL